VTKNEIIPNLPYGKGFLFVDGIDDVSETGITGHYQFKEDEYFYTSHFKKNPVTPGVILIECMAQIGLVCLGIYMVSKSGKSDLTAKNKIALSSSEIEFLIPVYPKEKVTVTSEMVYFRFNKLKCKVKMINSNNELVCKGILSGMMV
jgi:3-hydroxyacyl-[acyl-carrier-protein] dehydratase